MYDSLIDSRVGVIRCLQPRAIPAQFPTSFTLTHAVLSDTTRFSPWPADSSGAGYSFADPQATIDAAIGEAAERYSGNLIPPDLPLARHSDLIAAGREALDPTEVCLYSADQYAEPGFPATALTTDLLLHWVEGTDLGTGRPVAVPACLVWVSWFASTTAARTPLTNPVIQAGLAAGPSRDFARAAAIREVIERDAMTLAWYGGRGVHAVRAPRWLSDFARGPRGALSTRFLRFPSEFGPPVLGALVFDQTTGYLTLGAGVHHDPSTAALKAFGEALQLQLFTADYDDPTGSYAAIAERPGSPLKPWRADRHYAQSYRPDLRDAIDYGCHLQLHLDPDVQTRFLGELDTAVIAETDLWGPIATPPGAPAATEPDAGSRPSTSGAGDSSTLVAPISEAGHHVIAVDLSTPDVAAAGLHVTRVLIPGLYSNSPIGLPFNGGRRLADARRRSTIPAPTVPLPH